MNRLSDNSGQSASDGSCLLTVTRLCRLWGSPLTTPSQRQSSCSLDQAIPLSTSAVQIRCSGYCRSRMGLRLLLHPCRLAWGLGLGMR